MNDKLTKLALDAGLLNYVDNETPRHYFVHGYADLEDVQKFAESIIEECIDAATEAQADFYVVHNIKTRFGVDR